MAAGIIDFVIEHFLGPVIVAIFKVFLYDLPVSYFQFCSGSDATIAGVYGTFLCFVSRVMIKWRSGDKVPRCFCRRFQIFCCSGIPSCLRSLLWWRMAFASVEQVLLACGCYHPFLTDALQLCAGFLLVLQEIRNIK